MATDYSTGVTNRRSNNTSNVQDQPNDDQSSHEFSNSDSRFAQSFGGQGDGRRIVQQQVASDPTLAVLKNMAIQSAIGHPLTYARTLIQIGYEPMQPEFGKTLFGKQALFYPNVFRYLKFIYHSDGFTGLYRGFGCALASKMFCWYATSKVDEISGSRDKRADGDPANLTLNKTIKKTLREVQCQSWGILISHPFQVMTIRCMGQFIGRETTYSSWNIFQNIQIIYEEQGIGGFFTGLVPRWLLEIAGIVIANMIVHLLKTQVPAQGDMLPLYEYMGSIFAQTATYPLAVISTVMIVNQSRIRAGVLPLTPIYSDWQEAYRHLARTDQLKRGSGLFNRPALGPAARSFVASQSRINA